MLKAFLLFIIDQKSKWASIQALLVYYSTIAIYSALPVLSELRRRPKMPFAFRLLGGKKQKQK